MIKTISAILSFIGGFLMTMLLSQYILGTSELSFYHLKVTLEFILSLFNFILALNLLTGFLFAVLFAYSEAVGYAFLIGVCFAFTEAFVGLLVILAIYGFALFIPILIYFWVYKKTGL
jgi:hypothetical protein